MANATQKKFGHPSSVIAETRHWSVQLRPAQPTLGSLVLICTQPVQAFGAVSPAAFAELQEIVARVEKLLSDFVSYQRINYLMLMMVDPDVHFHVIPRYEGSRDFSGVSFPDKGWPGPPALGDATTPPEKDLLALTALLRERWTAGTAS